MSCSNLFLASTAFLYLSCNSVALAQSTSLKTPLRSTEETILSEQEVEQKNVKEKDKSNLSFSHQPITPSSATNFRSRTKVELVNNNKPLSQNEKEEVLDFKLEDIRKKSNSLKTKDREPPSPKANKSKLETEDKYTTLIPQTTYSHSSIPIAPNSQSPIAQIPPPIPPGSIEQPRPLPPPPSPPPSEPTPPPLNLPQQTPPVQSPDVGAKVKVERIEVLGNRVFSQAQLDKAVASFIGKEATFEDLLAIRTAITNLYTQAGYTTSGAFLPPQDVSSGVVKIQVVEGALERIEIQGLTHLRESYVRSRIGIAAGPPVNLRRLEEALQLLQLNPLLSSVQAELTAGTAPGLSVLTLKLKETPQVSAALIAENRDSPSVGETRGTAVLSNNNVLGLGDRITAELGFTEGVKSYNFSYDLPLNPRDGTLSLRYGYNTNRIIEQPFTPLDINGNAQTVSLGFRQPINRTPNSEFALSLQADWRQSQTFLMGDIPFSFSEGPIQGRSTISALRFSQEWSQRSSNKVLAARSQFSVGLDVLGATINKGAPDGRFFSWVGQFQYVQAIAPDIILIARAGAQLTPNSLLPLEQFSIGGVDTVRGYRQNQRVTDNGIIGSLEVRFPIIRDPQRYGVFQLAPFFDIGKAWNNKGENPSPSTLASLGVGLRWQLDPYFSARLDYGIPLTRISNQGNSLQDKGLHFSIRFQPF